MKTETASNPLPGEFCVRQLAVTVGSDDEECVLCPVRALRIFTARMNEVTPRCRNLYVSPSRSRPFSRNGLSYLLRETILESCCSLYENLMMALQVKAHDIRGVATSLSLLHNKSVAVILDAASWKTPSVFTKHYLRAVEGTEGDMTSLGATVAAGDIVN